MYRCQLISKEEMDLIENKLILVYSRVFLSFSKDKNWAINFLKEGNDYLKPFMLIINSFNQEETFSSNTDIEQFYFQFIVKKKKFYFFFELYYRWKNWHTIY